MNREEATHGATAGEVTGGAEREEVTRQGSLRRTLRYRAVDVAAILISWFFSLVLIGEAESTGRITEQQTFPLLLIGCLSALPIWWRRSHPVAMSLITIPAGLVTDAGAYGGLVVLYTLVTLRRVVTARHG